MDRAYVLSLVRSFETGRLTRREFLTRATIAFGSLATANTLLAACSPAPSPTAPGVGVATVGAAAPVATSSPAAPRIAPTSTVGLTTETVDYQGPGGEALMGYLARPEGAATAPAVVVIQEWWGLNEHIKDVARRFAAKGYVALAPDLYHGSVATEPNEAQKLAMELDQEAAIQEIRDAVAYLLGRSEVSGRKVGIVGFCMGGGLVLQTDLVEPNVGAAVSFYGRPLTAEEAPRAEAPVLGLYGSEDAGNPVESVHAMEAALNDAGVKNTIVIYDGAAHAFFNDTRASYDPEAAADAWQRTLAWFDENLKTS